MFQSAAAEQDEQEAIRSTPRVSFVIPVKNDAKRLRRCLASIVANRQSADLVEIVVADNGSTDDSAEAAKAFGARVLALPDASLSALRNKAASVAAGQILAFVDADHEIAADWVAAAVETLGATDVGAVGALCNAPVDGTWVQQSYDLLRRRSGDIQEVDWLGSGNMAVWRHVFESVGGFDERLNTCEDVDLCRRLRVARFRILQDPRLSNVHFGDPADLPALFRGELWRGRDNLRVSLRPPVGWRNLPSLVIPVLGLTLSVVAIGGLAIQSTIGVSVAIVAVFVILLLSAARAYRMLRHSRDQAPIRWAQALVVAAVYDAARAAALIWPGGHEARRRSGT